MTIARDSTTGTPGLAGSLGERSGRAAEWMPGIALAVLGLIAYRSIFAYDPGSPAGPDLEAFFFKPSEKSPLLIYGLVPLLISMRRSRLRAAFDPAGAPLLAAPLLAAGIAIFLWAQYVDHAGFMLPSLMLCALGGAMLAGGTAFARVLALPVLFLFFALPVPQVLVNQVIYPLQLLTVQYSSFLLDVLGMANETSGDLIVVSHRVFQVVEGCSGFRSIETLVMAAVVYGEFFFLRGRVTVLLVLFAPVVAFLLNGVRVLVIMLAPESETVTSHTTQGIVAIVAGVLVLAGIENATRPLFGRGEAARRSGAGPRPSTRPMRVATPRVAVAAAILIGLSAASVWMPRWPGPEVKPQALLSFSQKLDGWKVAGAQKIDRAFLGTVEFSEQISRRYVKDDREIRLLVGASDHQRRQLSIVSEKTLLPGSGWEVLESQSHPGPDGNRVTTALVGFGDKRRLVYHWYQGIRTPAVELARVVGALERSPARRSERAFVVRLSIGLPDGSRREEGLDLLRSFAASVRGELARIEQPKVRSKRAS